MGRPRSSSTDCAMTTRTSSRRCSGPCSARPRAVGVLEMDDQEPRDADEGDELEAEIMQADHAFGAESVGTTVDEGPADDEEELVGDAVVEHDEFASPEETALTVRDSAPGATDHDDPHPPDAD